MLAFITAKRDTQQLVVAVFNCPFCGFGGDVFINGVNFIALGVGVRRIEQNSSYAMLERYAWAGDALPVATTNADIAQALRNSAEIVLNPTPCIAKMGKLTVYPQPGIAKMGCLLTLVFAPSTPYSRGSRLE